MSATAWSKFFWADWLSDTNLRRCSPAARGLWMDMLCIAAQSEPFGYLVKDGLPLDTARLARNVSLSEGEVATLVAELESEGVFSRDRHGRIYSRRMVREAKKHAQARKCGKKGGVVSRDGERGIFARSASRSAAAGEGTLAPISHKPDAISQKPASSDAAAAGEGGGASGWARAQAALKRVAQVMGVAEAELTRRIVWITFPSMVAELEAQGCEAERDVWPTIARLAARLKRPPSAPQYFRAAILEARDARCAQGHGGASGVAPATRHGEWQDRLAVFAREGAWSSRWGPKPGEAGCLAPVSEIGDQRSGIGERPRVIDAVEREGCVTPLALPRGRERGWG